MNRGFIKPSEVCNIDVLEVPGCPDGSLRAVAYIKEKGPAELLIKTRDEGCVRVLRLILPLFGYAVVDVGVEGEFHYVKTKKST
ncbi:MAG: hypothetical protein ABWK05_06700 [Pyrobaculum sp.]